MSEQRDEPYGRVAIFLEVEGNRWDLLGESVPGAVGDDFDASGRARAMRTSAALNQATS